MGPESKAPRPRLIGVAVAGMVGVAAVVAVGLRRCGGSAERTSAGDAGTSSEPGAEADSGLPPAEIAARKAAAAPVEKQSPAVKRRYYEGRLRAARQALETQKELVAKLRKAQRQLEPDAEASSDTGRGRARGGAPDGGALHATNRASALRKRVAKAEVRLQQRRDEFEELKTELRAVAE